VDSKHSSKKPSSKTAPNKLVGTWKLMSADDRASPKDPWVPGTFGIPPSGYFIYDATGHCSVQIMTVPPVKLETPDTPTPAEALQIFNGYIAYYGTYTVKDGQIHQQVEGAWDPSQVGTDQARPYQLKDKDTLIIGDQVTYRRTLKRVC
jgi:hypothetical protein